VDGMEISPEELAALAEEVTAEDIARCARCVECDEIYFLKGGGTEDEDGD
jgi:hypothetical protein